MTLLLGMSVDLHKVGGAADRLGMSAYTDGLRRQHGVETLLSTVCELLLVSVLHCVLHEPVSEPLSSSHY